MNTTYRSYKIVEGDDGYSVNVLDAQGEFVVSVATVERAQEWIDEIWETVA